MRKFLFLSMILVGGFSFAATTVDAVQTPVTPAPRTPGAPNTVNPPNQQDSQSVAPQANPTVPSDEDASTAGSSQPTNINKMGAGSGDDVDTVEEADPANDKDPEADVDTDSTLKQTQSH